MGVIRRSRLKLHGSGNTLSIGSLTDPNDKYMDVPSDYKKPLDRYRDESGIPLLVIYAIDKDSKPGKNAQKRRADLNAVDDLIGSSIFFPISHKSDDLGEFAVVNGPWNIPPVGDSEDEAVDEDIADGEGDAQPVIPNSGLSNGSI
jgi:hypothetical protein